MPSLSLAQRAASTARTALQAARKNRIVGALFQGAAAAWRPIGRALRQLWHQVTGMLFFAFAVAGAFAILREWRQHTPAHGQRMALAAVFTLVFLWFGITSLWRAKKV